MNDAVASSQEILTSAALRDSVRQEVSYSPPTLTLYSAKTIPSSVLAKIRKSNPDVTVAAVKTKYDLEALSAEGYRIASSNTATVAWAAPNADLSGIDIGVITPTGATATDARTALPSAADFTTYPATVEPASPIATTARLNDTAPLYGGARIVNHTNGGQCTSGLPVNYTLASSPTTSRVGFMTAWHCGTGFRWDNTAGTMVGSANLGISDSRSDAQVVQNTTTTGTNRVWVGGFNSTSTRLVASASNPAAGQMICAGGSMSGEVCTSVTVGARLSESINSTDGHTFYPAFRITNSANVNNLNPCVAQPGDSGGPTYSIRSDGRVTVHGLINSVVIALITTYCPGSDPDHPLYDPVAGKAPSSAAWAINISAQLTAVRATARTG